MYFYKNQVVYEARWGKGVVIDTNNDSQHFPIRVKFENSIETKTFTKDGRYGKDDYITLSQNPIPPVVNVPFLDFKVGDIVRLPIETNPINYIGKVKEVKKDTLIIKAKDTITEIKKKYCTPIQKGDLRFWTKDQVEDLLYW